jgi:hypothetical protein
MRSKASARVRSHSCVKISMLPPKIVLSAARPVPMIERDRTTTPRTTPRFSTVRNPGSSKVVLVR